jgi:hypothetical protein
MSFRDQNTVCQPPNQSARMKNVLCWACCSQEAERAECIWHWLASLGKRCIQPRRAVATLAKFRRANQERERTCSEPRRLSEIGTRLAGRRTTAPERTTCCVLYGWPRDEEDSAPWRLWAFLGTRRTR